MPFFKIRAGAAASPIYKVRRRSNSAIAQSADHLSVLLLLKLIISAIIDRPKLYGEFYEPNNRNSLPL